MVPLLPAAIDQVTGTLAVNLKVPPWFTAGGTDGVITTCPEPGGPGGAIVMLEDFCAVCAAESVNTIVNEDVPASVGVPAIPPEDAFRLRPAGSALVTVQV